MDNEKLVSLIQRGMDAKKNLELLYLQNQNMISKLANEYKTGIDDFDDLMQEGYLGLEYAARHYDPEGGASFTTYAAKCITGHLIRYIHSNENLIRIPEFLYSRIRKFKRFISDYEKEYGRDPDASTIIRALHFTSDSVDELKRVIVLLSQNISIDQPVSDEYEDGTYADIIPDTDNQIDDLLDDMEKHELKLLLWNIVDNLEGKQPEVLKMRFRDSKTLKECSQVLHVSTERVRTIQRDGCRKIRQSHSKDLLPYYHDYIYSQGLKHTSFSEFRYTNESSVERTARLLEEKKTWN